MNKLDNNIIDLIIKDFNYKDTKNFLLTSSYFYFNNNHLLKDKFINEIDLKKNINNDYKKYKKYIKYVNKNKLINLLQISLCNIETIWRTRCHGYSDIRYIFEPIFYLSEYYNIYEIKSIIIFYSKNLSNYKVDNFIQFILDKLLNCMKDTRKDTFIEINKVGGLTSLHENFVPFNKYHYN